MPAQAPHRSVDLSAWRDMVVIYLGMRVRSLRGALKLLRIGRGFSGACARRGIDAIYIGMPPVGLARFAPGRTPHGPNMTARGRLRPSVT